jgi:hypothetical protein
MWRTDGLPTGYFDEIHLSFAGREISFRFACEVTPSLPHSSPLENCWGGAAGEATPHNSRFAIFEAVA